MSRWIVIGDKKDPFAQKTWEILQRVELYSTREIDGDICFGLKISAYQEHAMLYRTKWYDQGSSFPSIDFNEFIPRKVRGDVDKFSKNVPPKLKPLEGIQAFLLMQRAIHYTPLEQLHTTLESIFLPYLFERYPNGCWFFSTPTQDFHMALTALRALGAVVELADKDYSRLLSYSPSKMMTGAQPGGIFNGNKIFSIPLALFLPVMYGFVAAKINYSFVFLLGDPIPEIRESFPRSGLEFFRSAATTLFSQQIDAGREEITPELVDTFRLVDIDFGTSQIREFLDQYCEKLNIFFRYIVDPANFVDGISESWSGFSQYRTYMAFERLADEVILLLTEDTPYLRKMAAFRIFDQISALITKDHGSQAQWFGRLIIPGSRHDRIMEGLEELEGDVAKDLRSLLVKTREEILSEVLDSILVPGLYDVNEKIVEIPDGTTMRAKEFVRSVIRELRNTHHGYHTRNFDQYLSISTGSTPDSLPLIAVIAFFAVIAKPKLFFTRKFI